MEGQVSPSGNAEVERMPHFQAEPPTDAEQAWEQLEAGRYMPRRIRGSYRGRALG
jgi:hypothetical protein